MRTSCRRATNANGSGIEDSNVIHVLIDDSTSGGIPCGTGSKCSYSSPIPFHDGACSIAKVEFPRNRKGYRASRNDDGA